LVLLRRGQAATMTQTIKINYDTFVSQLWHDHRGHRVLYFPLRSLFLDFIFIFILDADFGSDTEGFMTTHHSVTCLGTAYSLYNYPLKRALWSVRGERSVAFRSIEDLVWLERIVRPRIRIVAVGNFESLTEQRKKDISDFITVNNFLKLRLG